MNILLKSQCEELQSNTCMDWGRQSHLHPPWTLGWVSVNCPVHKPGPCVRQQAGPVSMSMDLTGTEARLHTSFLFGQPETQKKQMYMQLKLCPQASGISVPTVSSALSLFSINTFPYMPLLISLRKMFSFLPCVLMTRSTWCK